MRLDPTTIPDTAVEEYARTLYARNCLASTSSVYLLWCDVDSSIQTAYRRRAREVISDGAVPEGWRYSTLDGWQRIATPPPQPDPVEVAVRRTDREIDYHADQPSHVAVNLAMVALRDEMRARDAARGGAE